MLGGVLVVIAMVLVLPVAIFLLGALVSVLLGQTLTADADARAEGTPQ